MGTQLKTWRKCVIAVEKEQLELGTLDRGRTKSCGCLRRKG
jgi:hypothetical protein